MKLRRAKHSMPELNTASLPDLIFTVLFFFMVITHMRENNIQVKYSQPEGKELTKIQNKSSVVRVFVGKPFGKSDEYRVQVDNELVDVYAIPQAIEKVTKNMPGDLRQNLTISFKADKGTPMWLITEVKQALREAGALKINYSAYDEKSAKTTK